MANISFSLISLKKILNKIKPTKIVLVSSERLISKLNWAIEEIKSLTASEIKIIQIPDGEDAKEWSVAEKLLKSFIEVGLDRKSLVIGLGGGSVTDMVGFASSIYERGIKHINIPTTLMGQVDASIGGKTAINFGNYKNQAGTFHSPVAIIIDTRFLKTLSKKQIIEGLAEIIKAGLIKDFSILKILKSCNPLELTETTASKNLILKSIKVKQYFVDKDFKDCGARQILNFGHTIGHALELKYNLSHGEAVLIGMLEELKIGEKINQTKPETRIYYEEILKNLDINLDNKNLIVDKEFIFRDKKAFGKEVVLPVIEKAGKARLVKVKIGKIINLLVNK